MSDKRKKNQAYYQKSTKKKFRQFNLEPGQKGFLCTCNNREKDCVRESYNILNKYTDKIYGTEIKETPSTAQNNEGDIEDDLESELTELKSKNHQPSARRFQVVDSGAKNMVFIRSTVEDTVKVARDIITDIYESQAQQTRFLIRLIPIEVTCKANITDIKAAFGPLIEKHFVDAPKVFSIIYNHRNNNCVSKDDVIKGVAELISEKRSDHSVNLKNADISVIIEVIKNVALLAVVPDFLKYKKFNLIVNPEDNVKQCTETNEGE